MSFKPQKTLKNKEHVFNAHEKKTNMIKMMGVKDDGLKPR